MKMFKKVVALILCLAFLLSFTACGDKNGGETPSTTESTTENKQNDKDVVNKENDGDDLLITLYPEQDSNEFHNLTGKIKLIETNYFYGADAPSFRFVAPRDGVKVRLEVIRWSDLVNDFEPYDKDFEITTEKGKIYEFMCSRAETIPEYRLVAEYNGKKAEYYMVMDGFGIVNELQMVAEDGEFEEITEDSAFYNLCVARAVSDVFYNDRLIKGVPEVVYETMAYAVTLNQFEVEGEDYINMIGLTQWEADAYLNAMYPTFKGEAPELPEDSSFVSAHFSTGKKYLVTPQKFEEFCDVEFYGVEDNGDGTYSVKIRVDDYRAPEVDFERQRGIAVIVKPDANNPFGYVITDVVDCDLPKG